MKRIVSLALSIMIILGIRSSGIMTKMLAALFVIPRR